MFAKSNACPGLPRYPGCLQIPSEPSNSCLSVSFLSQALFPMSAPALPATLLCPSSLEGKAVGREGLCPTSARTAREELSSHQIPVNSAQTEFLLAGERFIPCFLHIAPDSGNPCKPPGGTGALHKTPRCCCVTNPACAGCKSHRLDFPCWQHRFSEEKQGATLQISCHRQRPNFGI